MLVVVVEVVVLVDVVVVVVDWPYATMGGGSRNHIGFGVGFWA